MKKRLTVAMCCFIRGPAARWQTRCFLHPFKPYLLRLQQVKHSQGLGRRAVVPYYKELGKEHTRRIRLQSTICDQGTGTSSQPNASSLTGMRARMLDLLSGNHLKPLGSAMPSERSSALTTSCCSGVEKRSGDTPQILHCPKATALTP